MTVAEQITEPVAGHGEGPAWDTAAGVLRFVDMMRGDLLTLDGSGAITRQHVGHVAAAWRPRAGGGAVVAVERGFALLDSAGSQEDLPEIWSDPTVRMNDGACDPQGRFYCGSMAYDERPGAGSLYRLDHDHTVHVVLSGVTISNGLAWSPDGSRAYYVDTPTQRVDVFDYDGESLRERRPFVEIDAEQGSPDGIAVDAEGGVWVALWDGGAVHHYASTGRLDHRVEVPARQVSACAFGGPQLDQLYITTSRQGLSPGDEPPAGALFTTEPGVRGRPLAIYRG